MDQKETDILITSLKLLAFKIKSEIEKGLAEGAIEPEEQLYFRWKIQGFKYTENGVGGSTGKGEHFPKKTWYMASIKISETIKNDEEYHHTLELLRDYLSNEKPSLHYLEAYMNHLIIKYLDEIKFDESDLDAFIKSFIKGVKGQPLKYGAEVELNGIVVIPDEIAFQVSDTKINLRQTRVEDLEKESPTYFSITKSPFPIPPSAILNIEFLGHNTNEIQVHVNKVLTILRLFRVGSINYFSYRMHSESITDFLGIMSSGITFSSFETSKIKEEDANKLKNFWQLIKKVLPLNMYNYGGQSKDHKSISFDRYCESLLEHGTLERKITNTVMGLESLFLKGGETQELIYRLSQRIAKIFHLLGYDSYNVKEAVGIAYRVRSQFVHGGSLSYNQGKKIKNKFGDLKSYSLLLLEYLRVSIIIMLFIDIEKEALVDLLDEAMFDSNKDEQLKAILGEGKKALSET